MQPALHYLLAGGAVASLATCAAIVALRLWSETVRRNAHDFGWRYCAWCHTWRHGTTGARTTHIPWHDETRTSHGMCKDCARAILDDITPPGTPAPRSYSRAELN